MNRTDMHPADIIAQLKKRNLSLAAVSRQAGLSSSTLANTLARPWPKGEFLIAQALGIDPAEIWPSRYYDRQGNLIDRKKLIRARCE
ncbi:MULTISPECIES: helix-turn-helix transcriptional regulator [unclassified Raoultella]|uniref:helix-turn-helix domain-containing protein n=1 Tax=unclassified Raoultella TaxID=2627600 RepID=UPI00135CB845|nr:MULTISPECIES: helix-turn-helix transcriptional regulator [unclassified Raoultella]